MFTILIIDDDLAVLQLLKRTLKAQGYDIIIAENGADGLQKAKDFSPALIICDWLMPGLNGLEVCRQIKSMPALSSTFFILLTSLDSLEAKVIGLDTGADDFLSKPIQMMELQARVRAGLRLYQLNQDLQKQKQLLESELQEAADYLRSILPDPVTQSSVSIDWRFIPSRQLGGDCFDYYWLDADHLVFYLLDISGHGMRAALPALSVINLLRNKNHPQIDYYRPSSVLVTLNKIFQITQNNDKYFTIWYGVYQKSKSEIVYASAGHPPAILFSPQKLSKNIKVNLLKTPGIPIGMFPETQYINYSCQVAKSSIFYLFSDGMYEIHQLNQDIWGLDALISLFQENFDLDQIILALLAVNKSNIFSDDLSLMKIIFH